MAIAAKQPSEQPAAVVVKGKRRRRHPNQTEQAKRKAWGRLWGQVGRQAGERVRRERE